MIPPPAGVRYNEWHRVALPPPELFRPSASVSVVIPYYEQPAELARTLAALERQAWPRELFEVVVVDDGSKTPLAAPTSPLRVTVAHQEDRGFGLARARNAGAETAMHDILLFLDADMLPEAGWIGAHAIWHQTVCDAVTLGSRAFVAIDGIDAQTIRSRTGTLGDLFADRPQDASFADRHMARTRHLTAVGDDQFRVLVGSNFGIRRELFEAAGGFDSSFARWGGEDIEFGYRAQTIGGLLVPVADGFAWHQGRLAEDRERKDASFDIQRGKLAHLIAHHEFRDASPGRTFAVPQYVVTIDAAHAPLGDILDVAERILGGRTHDLVLRIDAPGNDERLPWLLEHLGPDPRIRVAPQQSALDEFPAAAFHVRIPATVRVAHDVVRRMRTELGAAVAAVARLADGTTASITRAWALHRARRNGAEAGRFGDVRPCSARRFGIALAPKHGERGQRRRQMRHRVAQLRVKIGSVRSPRQAWWFLAWLAGVLRWRLAKWERFRRRKPPAQRRVPSLPSDPLLGVRIAAKGAAARAVLGPYSAQGDAHVDVLLTDAPLRRGESATVSLADAPPMLSVSAFDAGVDNPMGWIHAVAPAVGALGPLDQLPTGAAAQHVVDKRDRAALRSLHHIEDVAAYHASARQRAGDLARLAAQGVVVHLADGGDGLRAFLGGDLHRLMLADIPIGDLAARERLSIGMRRAALRDHALASRVRQIAALALADPPPLPLVSILLASKRPRQLRAALAPVARQTYPRLELVFAAHGEGFADLEPALESLPCPWRLVRVPASRSFGGALNAATEAARGTLLAKMDDDDLYAAEHIWDLVLAHGYSKAELVGKGLEYVYLADADRTLRGSGRGESFQTSAAAIAGGALLISRQDLQSIGGWRRVDRHVDLALREDVAAAGGRIYRTHGAGFMLVRRGQGDWHTWKAEDGAFLVQAESNTAGWRPDLASLGDIPHPSRTHSA